MTMLRLKMKADPESEEDYMFVPTENVKLIMLYRHQDTGEMLPTLVMDGRFSIVAFHNTLDEIFGMWGTDVAPMPPPTEVPDVILKAFNAWDANTEDGDKPHEHDL